MKILELERSKGYKDVAVVGGVDRYLRNYLKKARDSGESSFASRICPPDFSYAALSKEQRRQWADKTRRRLAESPSAREATVRKQAARPVPVKRAPPPPSGVTLDSPITAVKGIGPSMASSFAKLGIGTVREMLYFFPRRHMDYGNQKRVSELGVGVEQTLLATVWEARQVNLGGRLGTEAIVGDETGNVRAVWFNQPYLARRFRTNVRLVLFGKVGVYKGKMVFESPEWEFLESEELPSADMLVPVYPLTEGLYPRSVRRLAKAIVSEWAPRLGDHLPAPVRNRCALMPLSEAVQQAHFPDSSESRNEARRRLAFDELFLIQMGVAARKLEWQETLASAAFRIDDGLLRRFGDSLPFRFTLAQQRALKEILTDVSQTRPMSRLLQGDVGSGKTVVATAALMMAAANGCQGALMAPTEILAEQHFNTISSLLSRLGASEGAIDRAPTRSTMEDQATRGGAGFLMEFPSLPPHPFVIALLTGSLKAAEKRRIQGMAVEGGVHLIIGTHALIQKGVEFQKLGLVVVDEQHRFGVLQRSALRQKGSNPHVLVMTATPIPRTLALTLYGDLDLSVIDEMPPGRVAIETRWLTPAQRQAAYDFVRRKIGEGRQAFVVCPLIEESENIEAKAAVAEYKRLSEEVFPDLRLGLLHGRMSSADKEAVMRSFKDKQLDILVSTPVVEVGIDVPNAVVMLIEGADRFGLSQLHQFRGRVGRGEHKSYCLLLAESPSFEGRERLKIIERTRDGFLLAEEDLRLRGPGEFFGTQQSGLPDLRMARLSDVALMEMARGEAIRLLESDRGLKRPEHRLLAREVARVWRAGSEAG
ncbi:MAG: ATP-dependent DNA helicase RecG [Dehalococcoidia bacterium]|nr:ATP-dependent DNA helicase RecG [Dehalococcoidia bacterium]